MMARDPDHEGVRVYDDYKGNIREECDVIVVGSGPGGAVAAYELAKRGLDVVLLEEGPPFGAKAFVSEPAEAMRRMFREAGMRVAEGDAYYPTMQVNALGGGSIVNSAICIRPPSFVYDKWSEHHGIDVSESKLNPHYEEVERFLGVAPTPADVFGARNEVFKRGCETLGISWEVIDRNVKGCKGSSQCFTGCPNKAKQSTDISYVPAAIRAGARVLTSVRAERVLFRGRKAVGIKGRVMRPMTEDEDGFEAEITARHAVVLAAGCLATPLIMMRSEGGRGPNGQIGRNLQFHPGTAIMGVFDHDIDPWFGATQAAHSLQYLEEGFKLEVLWAPPALLAVRFPGLGHDYQRQLLKLRRMMPIDVIAAATKSFGTVKPRGKTWNPAIRYKMHPDDIRTLHKGMCTIADIMWAAGANTLLPGLHGIPAELNSKADTRHLEEMDFHPNKSTLSCNHVFGSTRMGKDPKTSVTNEEGRVHHSDNLFIADSGIIPMSPAVNPMMAIMALSRHVSSGI